jgi:hypothetical protein
MVLHILFGVVQFAQLEDAGRRATAAASRDAAAVATAPVELTARQP